MYYQIVFDSLLFLDGTYMILTAVLLYYRRRASVDECLEHPWINVSQSLILT